MGRGRSSSGGRGASSSGRGMSSSRGRSYGSSSRTTVIIGGTRYYSSSSGGSSASMNPFIFGIVICILLAIPFLAIGLTRLSDRGKYGSVQAEVVENVKSMGWYYTIYDYTVNGIDYQNRSEEGWEFPETKHSVVIYYLKDDPNSITEIAPPSLGSCWACIGGGLFASSLAGLLIYGYVKSKKQEKNCKTTVEIDNNTSQTVDDSKVVCGYCGAKYNKEFNSCPHCGAGRK